MNFKKKDKAQPQQDNIETNGSEESVVIKKTKKSKNSKLILRVGAILITLLVLACMIVLTTVAEQLEDMFSLQVDFTVNQLYSISDTTEGILEELDEGVEILAVYAQGEEDNTIMELLRRYEDGSDFVELETIDPIRNPFALESYKSDGEEIATSSIIVVDQNEETNFRVIEPEDLYEWNLEGDQLYATSLVAEQRVTSAISSVMSGVQSRVFFVQGHDELNITDAYFLASVLENDGFLVEDYDLVFNDTNLEQTDTLVFLAPMQDLTDEEMYILKDFLEIGGDAMFLMTPMSTVPLPNFEEVMTEYGIKLNDDFVVETNRDMYHNSEIMLVPETQQHEVNLMLLESAVDVVMPRSRSLEIQQVEGVDVQPLFVTSADSYSKSNKFSENLGFEEGDVRGETVVAAASVNTKTDSRITVYGSVDFVSSLENAMVGGNITEFMGAISWLSGDNSVVVIPPKSLVGAPLRITSQTQTTLLVLLILVIMPVVILVSGAMVWRKRVRQ